MDDIASSSDAHTRAPHRETRSPAELDLATRGWIAGTVTSASAITDPGHQFFVHSCNKEGFKYKYPEAAPTPDGEDDVVWNKTYTAADSRMYNKNGKDANQSRKFRLSKETYTLSLKVHLENKQKYANKHPVNTLAAADPQVSKAVAKPKAVSTKIGESASKATTSDPQSKMADNNDHNSMSIPEKIKSDGRIRKPSSNAAFSMQSSPGPSTGHTMASPLVNTGSPAPAKIEKPAAKKKGTAAVVKKAAPKKAAPEAGTSKVSVGAQSSATKPPSADDSDSNDGGEYCICRGPDDHRMMVFCDGGCQDWYHCSCLQIDEDDALGLLDKFICPNCKTDTLFTTWKRMCRYVNVDKTHRKAANVKDGSKYCSKECCDKFIEYVASLVRKDDAPSMGGALNQKEVAMLLGSVKNAAEFHALGKKPRLPVKEGADPNRPVGLDYVTPDEEAELATIQAKKDDIKGQIEGFGNQLRLLMMINERAKVAAKHLNLEVKEFCGYDNRLAMNDAEFARWVSTEEGKKAFETNKLGPRTTETQSIAQVLPYPGQPIPVPAETSDVLNNICVKKTKKCKHNGWREMHNQDFMQSQNNLKLDLSKLEEREKEIIEDAETREATKEYYAHNVTTQLF
ncbi:uncharacterized protein LY89DRAFT_606181 [Mollisia scopiformis]|uniref:PHD-type domain-containing protein n=1 Tax=Mollisia scopiformis TaxID=149040 RepID=A0A194XUH3_MOLSC|nr:uncharacterized protein LY89DRAFT_606181 [Mollisia scopiformis]KUJ23357.1 hypothetical protein LY89DRAFT_606181 [Mollisia scopiformis]